MVYVRRNGVALVRNHDQSPPAFEWCAPQGMDQVRGLVLLLLLWFSVTTSVKPELSSLVTSDVINTSVSIVESTRTFVENRQASGKISVLLRCGRLGV